jgi:hypothetical protein
MTTKPLGMLAFKAMNDTTHYAEATDIRRIIDLGDSRKGANRARSVIMLRDGTQIESPSSANILVEAYHEIIHGRLSTLRESSDRND